MESRNQGLPWESTICKEAKRKKEKIMPEPWIVEVELVEGDLVGIRLSDDTVLLLSAEELLSLGTPRYFLLADDKPELRLQ